MSHVKSRKIALVVLLAVQLGLFAASYLEKVAEHWKWWIFAPIACLLIIGNISMHSRLKMVQILDPVLCEKKKLSPKNNFMAVMRPGEGLGYVLSKSARDSIRDNRARELAELSKIALVALIPSYILAYLTIQNLLQ